MYGEDDFYRLAEKVQDDSDEADRDKAANARADLQIACKTTTVPDGAYPTSFDPINGTYFWLEKQKIGGDQIEGQPASETPTGVLILAVCFGPSYPPRGQKVLAATVSNRWVFNYRGVLATL